MARKMNESTLKMIEDYPKLHAQGLSNREIAEIMGVSYKTVLAHLGDIADGMGVWRETLTGGGTAMSDNTVSLLQRYPDLHKAGLSNPDIAKQCHVSMTTLYKHLPKIAKSMGVSRDSLVEDRGQDKRYRKVDVFEAPDEEILVDPCDESKKVPTDLPEFFAEMAASSPYEEVNSRHSQILQKLLAFAERLDLDEPESKNTRVEVFVEDGSILVDGQEAMMDAAKFARLAEKLMQCPECSDLKVKYVPTMARLLKVVAGLDAYDILLDDRAFGYAFFALRQKLNWLL